MRRAVVFGGTGAVGSAVVRALHAAGVSGTFTYFQSEEAAHALAAEVAFRPARLDLTDAGTVSAFAQSLLADGPAPDVVIHSAGTMRARPALELSNEDWDQSYEVNARSAFLICRALAPAMAAAGGGNIVLCGGLDRSQSLPVPVAYAASQGMIAAMTMALAKELGEKQVRVNMVALGLLDAGLSLELPASVRAEYLAFSALRRFGSPREVADVIVWLALNNTYVSGKVLSVNGGI